MSENYKLQEFVAHSTQVNCLAIGPKSNQVLATGGEDTKINVWRIGNMENIWTFSHNKAPIECLCFDPEENVLVSGARNGSIKVFDLAEGKLARHLGSHPTSITSLQYHPYGELVVSGSSDCNMKVWDIRNKLCIQTYTGHSKEVTCVRFSPDGKWVASSSKDGQVYFFDLLAGKLVNSIKTSPAYVTNFEFNPAEFSLAAITSNRSIKVWDLDTMQCTHSTPSETISIKSITFSSLGNYLYAAAKDLKIWNVEKELKLSAVVETGWDRISDMRLCNNSQLIAGSFNSNFVSIWGMDLGDILEDGNGGNGDEQQQQQGDDAAYGDGDGGQFDDGECRDSVQADAKAAASLEEQLSIGFNQDCKINLDNRSTPIKSNSNMGAKASAPVVVDTPSPRSAQKISRVQQQLDQLSADLALDAGSISSSTKGPPQLPPRADAKTSSSSGSGRRAGTGATEKADIIESENSGSSNSSSNADSSVTEDFGKPPVVPGVTWDSGSDAADMATSMGESFWKRFKESQKERNESPTDANSRKLQRDSAQLSGADLSRMLPPSSFDSKPEASGRGVATTQQQGYNGSDEPAAGKSSIARASSSAIAGPRSTGAVVTGPSFSGNRRDAKSSSDGPGAGVGDVGGMSVVGIAHTVETPPRTAGGGRSQRTGASSHGRNTSNGSPTRNTPAGNMSYESIENENNSGLSEYQKCDEKLSKLQSDSGPLASVLTHRLASLRTLRQLWAKGEVLDAIDHLSILSDSLQHSPQNLQALADFFDSAELKGGGLSLDACVKLLPVLDEMIGTSDGWSSQHVVEATFKSLTSLAEGFGELIRNTRSVIVTGGVDLSREARLNKCNACHSVFFKAMNRVPQLKHQFRRSTEVVGILDAYLKLGNAYFNN